MTASLLETAITMGEVFGLLVVDLDRVTIPRLRESDQASGTSRSDDVDVAGLIRLLEETAGNGMAVLDIFLRFDREWRTSVFRGEIEHDGATEKLILDNIRKWAMNADEFVAVSAFFKPYGIDSHVLEIMRARIAEAKAMITPDEEFFEGEDLDRLAGEALAADERGETVEFTEMGR